MNPFWVSNPNTALRIRFWATQFQDNGDPVVVFFRVFNPQELNLERKEDFVAFPWQTDLYEIDGFLRWDGCINWQTSPNRMMHGCGPDHADNLAKLFTVIYWAGGEYMPGEFDQPNLPEGCVVVELN